MIWLPSIEQIIEMHGILIRRTGGLDGIRDRGLIESALARASAGFGDYERYTGVEAKAAALAHGLGSNHGFIDGNKRVGVAVMLLILRKKRHPPDLHPESVDSSGPGHRNRSGWP